MGVTWKQIKDHAEHGPGFEGSWPSGRYLQMEGAPSTLAMGPGVCRFTPLWVPKRTSVDRYVVDVSGAGVGGTPLLLLGVYSDDSGQPGSLLHDAGSVDASVSGLLSKTVSFTLDRGLVWMAVMASGATTTQPSLRVMTGFNRFATVTLIGQSSARVGFYQAGLGPLPSTAGSLVGNTTGVWSALRAAP